MLKIDLRVTTSENPESRDRILKILLWALIRLNREYLRMHPRTPTLYASGVRYIREPEGWECWPDIGQVLAMGGGDCEDLAAWRVAELLEHGIPARPAWRYRKVQLPSGTIGTLYHILVYIPGRGFEDPSRALGMGGPNDE